MQLLKKIIVIISIIWTAISVGYLALAALAGPSSCQVDNDEPPAELTGEIPDFEFDLMDKDTTVTKESIKGSYTLLYFWGTSCSACVNEMPYLHETYEELQDQNFQVIAISYDKSEEKVREFREQKYPMPWKHTVMGKDRKRAKQIFKSFGFQGSPHKVLVSPEGKGLETISGYSGKDLKNEIQAHLPSSNS